MNEKKSSIVVPVLLALLVTLPCAGTLHARPAPPDRLDKITPAGTPPEVGFAIRDLQRLAGLDPARSLLEQPYQGEVVEALIEAAHSPVFEIRTAALELLALTVRQLEVPEEALHQRILPLARELSETPVAEAGPRAERTAELAQRVLWHARIRQLDHEGQRLEALAAALDDRTDGYYYPIAALDYLADLGTEGAREVLEEKVAESERRSVSTKLMQRVRATGVKVDLRIRMRELAPEAQVGLLSEALVASLPERSAPARDLQAWIVRRIGEREGPTAARVLDQLATDETVRADLRYEAERALGAPAPQRSERPNPR